MSFTWLTEGTRGKLASSSVLMEIKDNADSLITEIGMPSFTWVIYPVTRGESFTADMFQELQDAIDYIDDNNYCSSNNTTNNAADCSHSTGCSSDNTSHYGTALNEIWYGRNALGGSCGTCGVIVTD